MSRIYVALIWTLNDKFTFMYDTLLFTLDSDHNWDTTVTQTTKRILKPSRVQGWMYTCRWDRVHIIAILQFACIVRNTLF